MCTLILAYNIVEGCDWLLGANRDENLDRPAEGPRLRERNGKTVLAPLDLKAGGTWIGFNASQMFAALTNRFNGPSDSSRRSRGELVFDALECTSAEVAAHEIAGRDPKHYNGFHLVVADAKSGRIVWSDGATMHTLKLEAGLTVVTERSYGAAENGRAEFLEEHLRTRLEAGELSLEAFREALAVRRDSDIDATSVYIPEWSYGTRSSILASNAEPAQFFYADGPPSDVAYTDHSDLMRTLISENS